MSPQDPPLAAEQGPQVLETLSTRRVRQVQTQL
jgi:hypothetical protein